MPIRSAALVLALTALAVPAAALAARPAPESGSSGSMEAALLVGIESSNGDSADVALRADGIWHREPIAPTVGFAIVGSIGFTRWADEASYAGVSEKATLNFFRILPAARLTFGDSPSFRPYVDAGIGLYTYSLSYTATDTTYGTVLMDYSDSDQGLVFRLAGGIAFQVSESFLLGGELAFYEHSGDVESATAGSVVATLRL